MAGRRDDSPGDAGQATGLGWTRRAALAGGLSLPLASLAQAAAATVDVPIRMAGNLPWTGVWLNKQGPFRFRIRSDGNVFFVSESLGQQLGLELTAGEWAMSGRQQHRRVIRFYRADEMLIGGQISTANTRLAIIDATSGRQQDENASDSATNPFVGSIPVPSDRITSFVWSQELMRFSPDLPVDIASYGKAPLRHFDSDLGWSAQVDCRLGGKPVRLSVSTASPYALTLNPDAVKRLGLWNAPGPAYDRPGSFAGGDVEVRVVRRGDLEIGGLRFERPVLGLRDPARALADVYNDGAIGMEVLRRADLIFDPKRDMSWMRPTAAMNAPWRHDRAGFQTGMKDGVRRFLRIDPGSPAERAGLLVSDTINLSDAGMAQLDIAQHAPAGTKLDIPIRRDGVQQRVSVVLEERL